MEPTSEVLRTRKLEPRGKRVDAGEVLRGHVSDQEIRHRQKISSDITRAQEQVLNRKADFEQRHRGYANETALDPVRPCVDLGAGFESSQPDSSTTTTPGA
jgi:hypothetical protein